MPRSGSKRVDDTAPCAVCRRKFKRTYESREHCSQRCRDASRFATETAEQRERHKARDPEWHRQRKHGGMTEHDALRARLDDDMRAFKIGGGNVTKVPRGATGDARMLGVSLSPHEMRQRIERRSTR